jgi:hypothetical protein
MPEAAEPDGYFNAVFDGRELGFAVPRERAGSLEEVPDFSL